MAENNNEFVAAITNFTELSVEEIETMRETAQKAVIKGVIDKTPIDTGQARLNWIAQRDSPANYSIPLQRGVKDEGAGAKAMEAAFGEAFGEDGTLYFTNNVVYAPVLEFGKYPSPVKYGTWRKVGSFKGRYEVRSTGGYSYQAPQGMARITVQEVAASLKG